MAEWFSRLFVKKQEKPVELSERERIRLQQLGCRALRMTPIEIFSYMHKGENLTGTDSWRLYMKEEDTITLEAQKMQNGRVCRPQGYGI